MNTPTDAYWNSFLEEIRKLIRPPQFQTWFRNLQPGPITRERMEIRVPNEFIESWLYDKYLDLMASVASNLNGGQRPEIHLVVDSSLAAMPDHAEPISPPPEDTETSALRRLRDQMSFNLNALYTFDHFVVAPSNRIAHAACVAISQSPGTTYNPLFLHGPVGLGKSHLLQATCHALLGQHPNYRIRYISCEQFVNEFITAIQRNEVISFRNHYRDVDALMIDDIQFLTRAERSQEEFFHTFNTLYNSQKQIVLTSDSPPSDMSSLQERLLSRFKSGLVTRLEPPHYETRVAILHKKAQMRSITLPDDVVHFVASHITSNIRELEGAITKIVGYASFSNEPINLELARKALYEPGSNGRPVTINDILHAVSKYFNVRVADIQSKKRHKSIAFPRQICMHLARSLTNHSLEEIGGYFGGRDHSTVLYADTKIRGQIKSDSSLQRTLGNIASELDKPVG